MKKLFGLMAAIFFAAVAYGGSYGILVNGNTYFAGDSTDAHEGFIQYLAHVQVNAGDYCQLYDAENTQAWVVDLSSYSVEGFVRNGNRYDISVSGCYDFYIKLKYQHDELYIGNGSNCGSGVHIEVQTTGFYLAGNGVEGGTWCCGESWLADGCPIDSLTNTITYDSLPAGSYAFKITDGTWNHSWGYDAVSAACSTPGYYYNTDHNVLFNTDSVGSVSISFDGTNICLVVEHMAAPDTLVEGYYLAGNGVAGKAWCCGLTWDESGCPLDSTGQITYPALPKGSYQFKITDGTWTNEWGYLEVLDSCSTPGYTGDNDGNVCFTTSATGAVTIRFNGENICLTVEKMYVDTTTHYGKAVPDQAPDVMLQGFFYDSFEKSAEHPGTMTYGDTKWSTLLAQAGEIGAYFDMVWLPPASKSSGGTGYHPQQYSNLASAWGSKAELVSLINALHNADCKVVADIVVNHADGKSGWCDFYKMNFTPYGIYEPDATWITNNDEVWSGGHSECTVGANAYPDDGYGSEANYAAARDWDHRQAQVQQMFRDYLKWMRYEVGFDGWRYDYCKGFWTGHINDYNTASDPYFSVMEYWDGNSQVLRSRIEDAGWNTLTFDFATKYEVFNNSMAGGNYGGCGAGMIGAGLSKYAVTFVDSHDSFLRDDNEFGGNGQSLASQTMKDRVLQANAYMLSMPGIPCVFYPHWVTFKSQIKKMINARHMACIHSESAVSDVDKSNGGYQATISGKNGYIVLQLGNKVTDNIANCTKYASGTGYAIWLHTDGDAAPALIVSPGNTTFRDSVEGLTVSFKTGGGTGDPVIYYTTDGSEPTTESASITKSGTITIHETTTLKAFAMCGTARTKTQTYTYRYKAPQSGPITVRFLKPADWNHVYFFAWTPSGSVLLGGWPGTQIYQGSDGWFSHTFDPSVKAVNFIINQGKNGVQSADLYTEEDACFTWEGDNEMEVNCDDPIDIPFSLSVSPDDCIFRDNVKGIDVVFTAIGDETATIYYTTDGSKPTESSDSFVGEGSINITATTTVKAFAKNATEKTAIVTRTYTYREPQTTPLIVKFMPPAAWTKVNLYAWTNDEASTPILGQWPGRKWTEREGKWYVYQFDAQYKSVNIIFNNGSVQSSDILLEEDGCYSWNGEANDALYDPNCEGTDVDIIRIEPSSDEIYKFILNDRLVIIRDGVMYDVLGHEL